MTDSAEIDRLKSAYQIEQARADRLAEGLEALRAPMDCGHPEMFWVTGEQEAASVTMCTAEATRPGRKMFYTGHCTLCAEQAELRGRTEALAECWTLWANGDKGTEAAHFAVRRCADEILTALAAPAGKGDSNG
jgi:hypothetical protein